VNYFNPFGTTFEKNVFPWNKTRSIPDGKNAGGSVYSVQPVLAAYLSPQQGFPDTK